MIPRPLHRIIGGACCAAVLALAVQAAQARAAEDPLRLVIGYGFQGDRLNSVVADSLGLSLTHGTVMMMDYDFRVFSMPMSGVDKPAVHLIGAILVGKRALPVMDFAGPGFTGAPIQEVRTAEMTTGVVFRLPMTMLDKSAGSAFHIGYRGGLVLSGGVQNDFPHVKQVLFGFERTRGYLAGSTIEMAYGTNEIAGREHGAHRWDAHVLFMGQLGRSSAAALPKPVARRSPVPVPVEPYPLHVFVELNVDTDGSIGPDLLMARAGLALDAGHVLSRVFGVAP